MDRPTPSAGSNALVTAVSIAILNGAAALAGVIFAREFGNGSRTDGLFLAFNVYTVLVLAASALRVVVLPELTRSAAAGRLRRDAGGYAVVLALAGAALLAVAVAVGAAVAVLSGGETASLFGRALPWFVLAGALQLLAGLASSALAALDDYRAAALGYSLAGLVGLALFGGLVWAGPLSLAWGLVGNAAVALAVPAAVLRRRGGRLEREALELGRRLATLGRGAALPIAIQALYAIATPFALLLGEGQATTFTYAYLVSSFLVAVTASSLSLISSAPLTRRGVGPEEAVRHVVATSWLSVAVVAPAVGVFALVGGRLVAAVLGGAYSGEVGHELGRTVVYLGPWMVASIAFSLSFPLLFVLERPKVLVPLAVALPLAQAPLAWGMSAAWGLRGLALSLALTTFAALAVLLVGLSPRALGLAAVGLGRLTAVVVALAALSFGILAALVGGIPAAAAGLLLYAALLALALPLGLRDAWAYVRALHS
ncbi:MAG TPA: hypothetical protein VFI37_14470 [Gaiellaceae bacterium]|nr:hypothetical protein [Gaiellaceae bacterium]